MATKPALVVLAFLITFGFIGPVDAHDVRLGGITVSPAWGRATIGNGVAYLTITNHGRTADRLLSVTSPIAEKATVHTSVMKDGVMRMRPVGVLEISPGEQTELKPGGLHVMLKGLNAPLRKGETFPLTLNFENAGSVEVSVEVQGPAAMKPRHDHEARS